MTSWPMREELTGLLCKETRSVGNLIKTGLQVIEGPQLTIVMAEYARLPASHALYVVGGSEQDMS